MDFDAEGFEGVERGIGNPLALEVLCQEGDVVVEALQALMLDGGDALQHLGGVDLRFYRFGCSNGRSRLVHEFTVVGSTRKRSRSVPGMLSVSEPLEAILVMTKVTSEPCGMTLSPTWGGAHRREELACWLARGLGFWHAAKIASLPQLGVLLVRELEGYLAGFALDHHLEDVLVFERPGCAGATKHPDRSRSSSQPW